MHLEYLTILHILCKLNARHSYRSNILKNEKQKKWNCIFNTINSQSTIRDNSNHYSLVLMTCRVLFYKQTILIVLDLDLNVCTYTTALVKRLKCKLCC